MELWFCIILLTNLIHLSLQMYSQYTLTVTPTNGTTRTVPTNYDTKQCEIAFPRDITQKFQPGVNVSQGLFLWLGSNICVKPGCKGPYPKTEIIIEIVFRLSSDIADLGLKQFVYINGLSGEVVDFEDTVENVNLKANQTYLLHAVSKPREQPLNGTVPVWYELYDARDPRERVDVCIAAYYEFES